MEEHRSTCLTLELAGGALHIISSAGLPDLSGGYHPGLKAIIHGGQLERQGAEMCLSRSDGSSGRLVAIGRDAAETISNFAAQCDGWITIEADGEVDPEFEAIIAGAQPSEGVNGRVAQRLGFKLRLASDVAPAHLAPPPWTLTTRGICDRNGALIYQKLARPVEGVLDGIRPGRPTEKEEKPEAKEERRFGLLWRKGSE